MSVLQDLRRSNATIEDILAVHGRIVVPTLKVRDLDVLRSLNLSPGSRITGDEIQINIMGALTINATTVNFHEINGDELHLKNTSNQITFGPSAQTTFNVDTTGTGTITFPSFGDSQVVLTEGSQTINGVKTFTDTVNFLAGFNLASLTLSDTSNQLILGTTDTITLNAPTPAASRVYTLPDVGLNASFVMTQGNQTIFGVKDFVDGFLLGSISLTDTSNQIVMGTGQLITVNAPTPAASRVYRMPDVGLNADFVMTEGNQTINGIKNFTSGFLLGAITLSNASNQITLGAGNTIILNGPAPAATRTYTFPDVLANANFVMTEGNQTINGVKNFTSGFSFATITLTGVANQIIMGTGTTVTINAPTPAGSRTYTTPDVGANANFVMTEGNQTINGIKTFTSGLSFSTLTLNAASNQLTLGAGNVIVINGPAPAASRVYTIPDAGANTSFVMVAGAQTITGSKTFSTTLLVSATTNQFTLGTGNTVTITSPAPAASRVYTIPDAGGAASFVMTAGTQSINGSKTFVSAVTFSPTSNQIVLGAVQTITLTAPTPAASLVYTIPDVSAPAAFVMTEGNQTINGVKTFTSSPVFPGLSFATLTLTATSNQLTLGTGQTIILNAPTPGTTRTYTLPDAGGAADFVLTNGTQAIGGNKSFSNALTISPVTNQLVLGTTNTTTLNAAAPAASRVYTIPDVLANASFVMTEGNQTINGVKTFTSGPIFPGLTFPSLTLTNTTIQLALGTGNTITINAPTPAASRIYTTPDVLADASFVMTEGNQTINGVKTFTSGPIFPGLTFPSLTLTNTTNQLALGTTNTTTINSVAPAASRVYTIPDAGTNTSFVMGASNQTIAGTKTFSSPITSSLSSNQLVFTNGGTTITLSVPTTGTPIRTYELIDISPTTSCAIVVNVANQTISGTKNFTGGLISTAASNQIVIGGGPVLSITTSVVSPLTYTIPDVSTNASFVLTEGAQTINGTKTFGSGILLPTTGGTPTALSYYEEFSTTINFNGAWVLSPEPSVTVVFIRVGSMVMMKVPGFSAGPITSPASSSLASTTMIPSRFRPLDDTPFRMTIVYNGNNRQGNSVVRSSGLIEMFLQNITGSLIETINLSIPPNGNIGCLTYTQTWMVI